VRDTYKRHCDRIDDSSTRDHGSVMEPFRKPERSVIGFQLPAYNAPRADSGGAFAELNSVAMTLEHIERGYNTDVKLGPESDGLPDILAIRAFCESERLLPSDVAADVIVIRWASVLEASFEGGIEVFEDDPPYANIGLRELSASQDALQCMGNGDRRV